MTPTAATATSATSGSSKKAPKPTIAMPMAGIASRLLMPHRCSAWHLLDDNDKDLSVYWALRNWNRRLQMAPVYADDPVTLGDLADEVFEAEELKPGDLSEFYGLGERQDLRDATTRAMQYADQHGLVFSGKWDHVRQANRRYSDDLWT